MAQNKFLKLSLRLILVACFWLLVWQAASMLIGENLQLFLPPPLAVFKKWGEIVTTHDYWLATASTVLRIFAGFLLGIASGFLIGILTGTLKLANYCLSPVLKMMRAVPVVSFIILAYLFINVNNLPIFISFLMVVPMVWQTTHDGIRATDKRLLEMAKVFKFGKIKTLFAIKIPSITRELITACVGALGFAWKSGVAAEVLCTPNVSLGFHVYKAKGNLDYDEVYALTLTVVVLSLVFETLLKYLVNRYFAGKDGKNAEN